MGADVVGNGGNGDMYLDGPNTTIDKSGYC